MIRTCPSEPHGHARIEDGVQRGRFAAQHHENEICRSNGPPYALQDIGPEGATSDRTCGSTPRRCSPTISGPRSIPAGAEMDQRASGSAPAGASSGGRLDLTHSFQYLPGTPREIDTARSGLAKSTDGTGPIGQCDVARDAGSEAVASPRS